MKCIAHLLLFLAAMSVGHTAESAFDVQFPKGRLIAIVSNADVYWGHEYPGLVPYLSPNAQAVLQDREPGLVQTVRGWLGDPKRFVVAHVLLTQWGEYGRFPVSTTEWNGLRVLTTSDGEPMYEAGQMEALQTRWRQSARPPATERTETRR